MPDINNHTFQDPQCIQRVNKEKGNNPPIELTILYMLQDLKLVVKYKI